MEETPRRRGWGFPIATHLAAAGVGALVDRWFTSGKMQELEEQNRQLIQTSQHQQKRLEAADRTINGKSIQIEELQRQRTAIEERKASLEGQKTALEEKVRGLSKQVEELQQELKRLKSPGEEKGGVS